MKKSFLITALTTALLLYGCTQTPPITENSSIKPTSGQAGTEYTPIDVSQLFSDRDYETGYKIAECIPITLQETGASGSGVSITGSTVTITKEGSYLLCGSLTDGMIIIDTDQDTKVQLILDGADIHSETSAPIYIKQADKVFITLAEGSTNRLSCGDGYIPIDENNIDAAIFSKDDLTLNGSGALTISSPAGHGIVSKDDLRITGGSYTVTCAGHGLAGNDAVSIADGSFTIQCGKDGIHGENDEDTALGSVYIGGGSFQITSDGDGISTSASMQMDGGEYNLLCGGGSEYGEEHPDDMFGGGMGGMGGRPGGFGGRGYGEMTTTTETDTAVSAKGIKSTGVMVITSGTYHINSADDAVHSNNALSVAGGTFQIATGDDGFHADEALSIRNGTIVITESYEGLEGLSITVSGGDITLKASDDGLNAAGGNDESGFGGMVGRPGGMGGFGGDRFGNSSDSFIVISGGKLTVDADGDGIDSNGNLTFSGGYTVVEGPTNGGNGPLDYGGTGTLSGGTILISGSSGMAQSLTATGIQGVFAINVGACNAGTTVTITDPDGKVIQTLTPQKKFGCVIVSTPDIIKGVSYTIDIGSSSGTFEAN